MSNFWKDKKVCVTGGAALIGSHLVEQLVADGADVRVIDDLSSGFMSNLPQNVSLINADASDYNRAAIAFYKVDTVFHLACAHGGRTYVDTHANEMYQNLALDATVFKACKNSGVQKVIFMSSACAYPVEIQRGTDSFKLKEDFLDYNNLLQPDGAYGFSKLAGELGVRSYSYEKSIVRGFTVYGPRMKENHAICALIAKTFIKQEPFEIYGDGYQKRNWTFVDDTARGIKLAGELLHNDVVNIGTEEVNTPLTACEVIWNYMGWRPQTIKFIPEMIGPYNRIADSQKAKQLLDWEPSISFKDGVQKTIDWYVDTHTETDVRNRLRESMFKR